MLLKIIELERLLILLIWRIIAILKLWVFVRDTLHFWWRRQDILATFTHIHRRAHHHRVKPTLVLPHGKLWIRLFRHRAHICIGIVSFDVLVNDGGVLVRRLYIYLRQTIIIMVSLLCVLNIIGSIGIVVRRFHQRVLLHHNGLILHWVEKVGRLLLRWQGSSFLLEGNIAKSMPSILRLEHLWLRFLAVFT